MQLRPFKVTTPLSRFRETWRIHCANGLLISIQGHIYKSLFWPVTNYRMVCNAELERNRATVSPKL